MSSYFVWPNKLQTLQELRSGKLKGIRHLKLSCGLTRFPCEILTLADTLEILDLSGNALSELPAELSSLTKLRIIFCSDNAFTELPEVLGNCHELSMIGFKANRINKLTAKAIPPKLRWLILTDNAIKQLPDEIGNCTQLQKLMLAGNQLTELPISLSNCSNLELLRIAANQFETLPIWLLTLPRLSWLAFSGNPFTRNFEAKVLNNSPIDTISWHDLEFGHLIGEGASGHIYQAIDIHSEQKLPLAVKVFKGSVTSDGFPESEMASSIAVGKHRNLINVFGKIDNHPDGKTGVVMELVDPSFLSLAGPPSLESCTRDIYSANCNFNLDRILCIAYGVASAARHIHVQGIMHGDLYGHNILLDEQDKVLIGDFGAASFYPVADKALASKLERLEVRAFGCLLEELLDLSSINPEYQQVIDLLGNLKINCLSEKIENRPLFDEICRLLEELINIKMPA